MILNKPYDKPPPPPLPRPHHLILYQGGPLTSAELDPLTGLAVDLQNPTGADALLVIVTHRQNSMYSAYSYIYNYVLLLLYNSISVTV